MKYQTDQHVNYQRVNRPLCQEAFVFKHFAGYFSSMAYNLFNIIILLVCISAFLFLFWSITHTY